jgi:pyruvate-formate lyase-activating enzyme
MNQKKNFLTALVANSKGEIFDLEGYAAVGRSGDVWTPLNIFETEPMPDGSELMFLPDRKPVLYNINLKQMETLSENPYVSGEPLFPVAVFNSPGYVLSQVSAYEEEKQADFLPLFSYGAVGWSGRGFRSAVIRVDKEPRQDLKCMPIEKVAAGARALKRSMPDNRLRAHIENCALVYGCPAAKNFFLGRYEVGIPTSQYCNARCLGCISLQQSSPIPNCQERITFTPSSEEIAEIIRLHFKRVRQGIASFGQGCEGDPLLAADVIEPAIREIRSETSKGTLNMNTNASLPTVLSSLFDAGLDSIRVSINSFRETCYQAYFRPKGYHFTDVMRSIDTALQKNRFVAVNYLNCPGVTDTPEEFEALKAFLKTYPIHMIQWRNLNFDPLRYRQIMRKVAEQGPSIGMHYILKRLCQDFPTLRHGYFNPPKESFVLSKA